MTKLTLGLIVNPVAGLGGRVALKGSDGKERQAEARARGGEPRGLERANEFLRQLEDVAANLEILTWQGLGADCDAPCELQVVGMADESKGAENTIAAAKDLLDCGIDLLVFVGGDGTARDILSVAQSQLCLGIPAGVKMHSGVFAVTPKAASEVVKLLLTGGLVARLEAEVIDFVGGDGDQADKVRAFGHLTVPEAAGFLQHTKEAGRESEPLVLAEIVADCQQALAELTGLHILLGPGGTVAAVKEALGIKEPTLRGFDIVKADGGIVRDADHGQLAEHTDTSVLLISFTRNQGFLLGRGNLQLTPDVLRRIGRSRTWVLASRSKLLGLQGRPLLVDTGDDELNQMFSGVMSIRSGYEDRLLYRVSSG